MATRTNFIPNVTYQDILEWKEQISLVSKMYYKGKWANGKESLTLMEEILKNMKEEFALGEGILVY